MDGIECLARGHRPVKRLVVDWRGGNCVTHQDHGLGGGMAVLFSDRNLEHDDRNWGKDWVWAFNEAKGGRIQC